MPSRFHHASQPYRAALVLGLVSTMSLTGCGNKTEDQDGAATAGQVIAHVGPDPITVQELDNELRLANVPLDKRSDAVTKRALGEIVVRKYLTQRAVAAKLDREPTVHLDILREREQVLASAIAQRMLASKTASIGKSEIDQYIGAHAAHFAKREILNIEQISMPAGADSQGVVDATKAFKTLDQVEQKLKELGVPRSRSTGVLDSGAISDEFLAALRSKRDDDIFFVRNEASGTFFKITDEQSRPLTGDEAANRARQLMRMDLLKAAGEQAVQAANASAKFEGNYAKIMGTAAPEKAAAPAKN